MIETIVQVDGMMCGMCESHINDAIRSHFQVKKVSSSHTKGQTVIQSQEPLDREQLVRVINDTGYQAGEVVSRPLEKRGLLGRLKKGPWNLRVCMNPCRCRSTPSAGKPRTGARRR